MRRALIRLAGVPAHGDAPCVAAARRAGPRLAVTLLALALAGTGHAQEQLVIYRCTDAQGQLTIQNNVPCPKGSKQVRRVMDTPPAPSVPYVPPTPAAAPAPAPPKPEPAPAPVARRSSPLDRLPPSEIAPANRLPPPVLYECRTYDNDSYLDEHGAPPPRCVTLSTVGLGGYVDGGGTGAACEMKTDTCQRIPDGALCDSWRRRLREAESVVHFGVSENQAKAGADLERIAKIIRDSTCGL